MVDTEEHKVDKFLDGLNFNIRERLTAANITDPTTKSMVTCSHFHSGIGRGYNNPPGL
jgi:hypothetical protein